MECLEFDGFRHGAGCGCVSGWLYGVKGEVTGLENQAPDLGILLLPSP